MCESECDKSVRVGECVRAWACVCARVFVCVCVHVCAYVSERVCV